MAKVIRQAGIQTPERREDISPLVDEFLGILARWTVEEKMHHLKTGQVTTNANLLEETIYE